MEENKGITLVALVITIIVLLILAGISIMAITNTGLFNKAKKAEKENNIAQVVEDLKLKVTEVQTEKKGDATLIDFVNYLSKDENEMYIVSLGKTATIQGEIPDLTGVKMIYVTYKNVECKVDEALNVEYSASVTSSRDETPTLTGCSRYIDVKIKKGVKQFKLSVDIPDTDKIKKIQYFVDNKKVYEGTDKSYTVKDLEIGKEYNIYAIVTYSDEKITQTATAIGLPDADIYVAVDGNDDTGDGSDTNPYASVKKAIEMATDGQKIYIEDGTYELDPMKTDDSDEEAGIFVKKDKKIEIFGDNEKTILKFDATKVSSRDGVAMGLKNSETVVRNLTYIFMPKSGDNYQRAMFWRCDGRIQNIFFRISGKNYASYLYYNNQSVSTNIINCTFFHDKKDVSGSYSGKANYTNIATNVNTNGTRTNVIVKDFGNAEDSIEDLIEKSKNDNDFNTNQAGVFYGEHAWDK